MSQSLLNHFLKRIYRSIENNENHFAGDAAFNWSPSDLGANLHAHWKADAGVVTSGSNVTTWTDQVSGYVATGQNTPTLDSADTTLNSQPTIDVGGTSYFSVEDDAANDLAGDAYLSAYFILKRKSNGSAHPIFDWGLSSAKSLAYAEVSGSDVYYVQARSNLTDGSLVESGTTTINAAKGWFMFNMEVQLAEDLTQSFTDNVAEGSISATNFAQGTFDTPAASASNTFFSWLDGTNGGDWEVAEILFVDKLLSTTEKDSLAWYMNNKYDIGIEYLVADPSIPPAESGDFTDPSDITQLMFWLDASDATSLTVNGSNEVTAWTDKSDNALSGTIVNAPTRTVSYNGNLSVSFNGSNTAASADYIKYGTQLADLLTNAAGYSIFVVANSVVDDGSDQVIFDTWLGTEYTKARFYIHPSYAPYSFVRDSADNGGSRKVGEYGMTEDVLRIWDSVSDLSGLSISLLTNGDTETYTTDDMNFTDAAFESGNGSTGAGNSEDSIGAECYDGSIGGYPFGSTSFNGDICEIVVYRKALTVTEANNVRSYLATKWGVTLV